MAIGFVVFNFNQNSVSSVEAEKSPVNWDMKRKKS